MKRIDIGTVLVDDKGNQYTIEDNAGDGGFSRVYKASCDGEFYAIKVLYYAAVLNLRKINIFNA